jgi:hypothetical protein
MLSIHNDAVLSHPTLHPLPHPTLMYDPISQQGAFPAPVRALQCHVARTHDPLPQVREAVLGVLETDDSFVAHSVDEESSVLVRGIDDASKSEMQFFQTV